MIKKRRIIWLSDEEWDALTYLANERHATISQLIRDKVVTYGLDVSTTHDSTTLVGFGTPRPAPKPRK